METSGDIIIQKDEIEWIERQKHNLILRTYRLNTQRLIKEYELKIQQQNRKIEFLLKEVKRQKFIIDTFSNENNGNIHNESLPEISNGIIKNDIESDSELEEIFHPDTKFHGLSHENAKSKYIQENICKKINKNDLDRTEIERKNTSLLSIEIKPQYQCNIQPLVNVYICDECNKTVSSRRVLAVCSINSILYFLLINFFFFIFFYRNISEWFIVHKKNLCVIIVLRRFAYEMV